MHQGLRSALEYAGSGDLAKAHAARNPDLAPHLEFVDLAGHGYARPSWRATPDWRREAHAPAVLETFLFTFARLQMLRFVQFSVSAVKCMPSRFKAVKYFCTEDLEFQGFSAEFRPLELAKQLMAVAERISYTLFNRNFELLTDADHVYLCFTPALAESKSELLNNSFESWYKNVLVGFPDSFLDSSLDEQLSWIHQRTFSVLRDLARSSADVLVLEDVEKCLRDAPGSYFIRFKAAEKNETKVEAFVNVPPANGESFLKLEVTHKGALIASHTVRLRHWRHAYELVSKISIKRGAIAIDCRKAFRPGEFGYESPVSLKLPP